MEIFIKEIQRIFALLFLLTSFRESLAIFSNNFGHQIMSGLESRFQTPKLRSEILNSRILKLIPPNSFTKRMVSKNYILSEKAKGQISYNPNSIIDSLANSKEMKGLKLEESAEETTPDEIVWRQCSAKRLTAYLDSNVKIRCALWAPLGTKVSWFKDDTLKFIQTHEEIDSQELLTREDFDDEKTFMENQGRSKYEFHVVSLFYIDCVKEKDEGTYEMVVQTPNGRNYTRAFKLETSGYSYLYSVCCENCFFYQKFFNPRIIDFAKTVIGKAGKELYLPCRPEISTSLTVIWNKTDRELDDEGYSITEQGDLKIHNLTSQDYGMYKCELYHNEYFIKYDQIQTYVMVLD